MNTASKLRLESCHKDLRILFTMISKKFEIRVKKGHICEEEQNDLHMQGQSKFKYPCSKHNRSPSMAVDVEVLSCVDEKFFAGCVMGAAYTLYRQGFIKHQLSWGGNHELGNDHFELIENDN